MKQESAHHRTFPCPICGKERRTNGAVHAEMVHGPTIEVLLGKRPGWSPEGLVCADCLNQARAEHLSKALEKERGEISELEGAVIRSLEEQEVLSQDINAEFDRTVTLGERVADRVAAFGGSWRFMFAFAAVLLLWVAINSVPLARVPFDPYPFILLNLVLSCLAAIQAPVIMMSQNRQEAKDRRRSEHDYQVNLKAELEIRHLHAKVDQLLGSHWHRLLEIQQIQLDLMEEIAGRRD
jgi:uncharacterized membrane protein